MSDKDLPVVVRFRVMTIRHSLSCMVPDRGDCFCHKVIRNRNHENFAGLVQWYERYRAMLPFCPRGMDAGHGTDTGMVQSSNHALYKFRPDYRPDHLHKKATSFLDFPEFCFCLIYVPVILIVGKKKG
jgi:hypothetical protein